ncbi:MAG: chemotaxis protein CheX [Desulfobacterales bacterium]|nr:chemotaxis protein CheX [Desulfobacterales bacterium]
MDVKYINPFISASMDVFSTFAGVESSPGTPSVRVEPLTNKDINGFISLNGHGISGYFIINFSASFLQEILAAIFDHTRATREELYDLAGELTNMITGSAKAELSKKGYFFDVAVPKISHTTPVIPDDLKKKPIIVVPFDTRAGKFHIEASIQRIEEDFQQDTLPEVEAPDGYISVDAFAKETRMDPIKVRRLLKTGFLNGKKISNSQWHIPEEELFKIQGYRPSKTRAMKKVPQSLLDETISVKEFSRLSGLSSAKIKGFLRSGFLKGVLDDTQTWRVRKGQISKFIKNA